MSERAPAPPTIRLIDQIPSLRGHFCVEDGYHAAFCMDLEPFVKSPERVESRVALLAERLRPYEPDVICGRAQTAGHLAMMVARALGVRFLPVYPEQRAKRRDAQLPQYKTAGIKPSYLAGARIAIVDTIITAGSEVRAVREC